MLLTEKQRIALTEFMKMVLSRRTATRLSNLIGSGVEMEVSSVSLYPLSKLISEFSDTFQEDVVSVHQTFNGKISGDALLVLNYSFALMLTTLLQSPSGKPFQYLNVSDHEVLTEIGNILLNSYISILSSLTGCQFSCSVPNFQIEPLPTLVKELMLAKNEVRYVLMVDTTFHLYEQSVGGYLVFVSGVIPLSCVIRGIEASLDLAIANS